METCSRVGNTLWQISVGVFCGRRCRGAANYNGYMPFGLTIVIVDVRKQRKVFTTYICSKAERTVDNVRGSCGSQGRNESHKFSKPYNNS